MKIQVHRAMISRRDYTAAILYEVTGWELRFGTVFYLDMRARGTASALVSARITISAITRRPVVCVSHVCINTFVTHEMLHERLSLIFITPRNVCIDTVVPAIL